jgi:O-glycosyl hydrolase
VAYVTRIKPVLPEEVNEPSRFPGRVVHDARIDGERSVCGNLREAARAAAAGTHPGARRIAAASSRSALLSTAFVNPDGKIATVVMNGGDAAVNHLLCIDGYAAEVTSPARSMQTLVC